MKHESTTEFDTGGERYCCGHFHHRLAASAWPREWSKVLWRSKRKAKPSKMIIIIILVLSYLIWNLLTFWIMASDKIRAKRGGRRIPESTLFTLALLMGAVGIFGAMIIFRHKTKKLKFMIGIPILFILNAGIVLKLLEYWL